MQIGRFSRSFLPASCDTPWLLSGLIFTAVVFEVHVLYSDGVKSQLDTHFVLNEQNNLQELIEGSNALLVQPTVVKKYCLCEIVSGLFLDVLGPAHAHR